MNKIITIFNKPYMEATILDSLVVSVILAIVFLIIFSVFDDDKY